MMQRFSFMGIVFLLFSFFYGSQPANGQETVSELASDTAIVRKLIQLARDNYPKIKAIDAEVKIAELNVNKSKLSWFDVLSASYFRTENIGGTLGNSYLLNGYQYGISLNIGRLLEKPANTKTAKQNLLISMLQKDEYDLALVKQVKQRYYVYLQQQATYRLLASAVLDADNNVKSLNSKFEKGEETFENYNKALMSLNDQNQAKIAAEANLFIAKAELEELIGTKIEYVRK
jgi:outer membrane protein TolC